TGAGALSSLATGAGALSSFGVGASASSSTIAIGALGTSSFPALATSEYYSMYEFRLQEFRQTYSYINRINILPIIAPEQPSTVDVSVSGPNPEEISKAMFTNIVRLANNEAAINIGNCAFVGFTVKNLEVDPSSFNIESGNQAVGQGIWIDVVHRIEAEIVKDWVSIEYDGYATVKLRAHDRVPYSTNSLCEYRGIGLFICFCLIWKIEPISISPALIAFLISQDWETATSHDLLQKVSPQLNEHLSLWPPTNPQSLLNVDPAYGLVIHAFGDDFSVKYEPSLNASDIRSMSDEDRTSLTPVIRAALAFNSRSELLRSNHPVFTTLIDGLNAGHLPTTFFSTVFGSNHGSVLTYVKAAWAGRIIQSWEQVLPLLNTDDIISAGIEYEDRERGFMAGLL
ncbi:hypothetical protein EV360DRAFT_77161, partial [Lentinula raphanica]